MSRTNLPHPAALAALALAVFAFVGFAPAAAQEATDAAPPTTQPADGGQTATLRVLDDQGQPLAGAHVGNFLAWNDDAPEGDRLRTGFFTQPDESAVTGDDGTVQVPASRLFHPAAGPAAPASLIGVHPQRQLAGLTMVRPSDADGPIELRLEPASQVAVTLQSKQLEELGIDRGEVQLMAASERMPVMMIQTQQERLDLLLPPGRYMLMAMGEKVERLTGPLNVTAGKRRVPVEMDLAPAYMARLIGREAPELRQIKGWKNGEPVTLESLRGKVVLLDFWGFWCPPCIHAMPRLMELHDKYKDEGLVIIAVHDDSVESLAELEQKIEEPRAQLWDGRDLPFLVALDGGGVTRVPGTRESARGATTAAYGVNAFPTSILIGRDGKVIGKIETRDAQQEATLREALGLEQPAEADAAGEAEGDSQQEGEAAPE